MLGFPQATEFNKRIPKQKFYEKLQVSPAIKCAFTEQIKLIYWRNKLAATTLNVATGEQVTEIELIEIRLLKPQLEEAVLRLLDAQIDYHILFLLTYEGKCQAWIGYKEAAAGTKAFKVSRYYHTDWLPENELSFRLEGFHMDAIYDNLVRQIAGDELQVTAGESLKDSVERAEKRQLLEKQIAALEAKIRNEKQLNRQIEMNTELKKMKKELTACYEARVPICRK